MKKFYNLIVYYLKKNFFFTCSSVLSLNKINKIYKSSCDIKEKEYDDLINRYEKKFSKLISPSGACISFLSARMALFEMIKYLNLKPDDEVIITAFTCSVIPTTLLRHKVSVIYTDVDLNTYGSSFEAIRLAITSKTKMVIAQHSFGIPCDIDRISEICKQKKIFLLEDCAISFNSKLYGKKIGTWGDAAIYSTDHTKPINTVAGGFLFSMNNKIIEDIKKNILSSKLNYKNLIKRQKFFYYQLKLENLLINRKKNLFNLFYFIFLKIKLFNKKLFVMDKIKINKLKLKISSNYHYPSFLTPFQVLIGLEIIENIKFLIHERNINFKKNFKKLLILQKNKMINLPDIYNDSNRKIIPFRIIFTSNNIDYLNHYFNNLDNTFIWYRSPIIGIDNSLLINLSNKMIPNSLFITKRIYNLPLD